MCVKLKLVNQFCQKYIVNKLVSSFKCALKLQISLYANVKFVECELKYVLYNFIVEDIFYHLETQQSISGTTEMYMESVFK